MFCGECGTKNPDTNQFCKNCGKPLKKKQLQPDAVPAPAASSPASPGQVPPSRGPARPKIPGASKKFAIIGAVIVVVIIAAIFYVSSNSLKAGSSSTGSANIDTSLFKTDSSASVSASNAALQTIAGYLEAGDVNRFNDSLSMNAHALMSGPLNIPADRAAKAGQALKKAKVTSASMDVVFYQTDIDGRNFSFDMAKEGGVWKLDQF